MATFKIMPPVEVTFICTIKESRPVFSLVCFVQIDVLAVHHGPVRQCPYGGRHRAEHRVVRCPVHGEGRRKGQFPSDGHVAAPGKDVSVIHSGEREDGFQFSYSSVDFHDPISLCGLTLMYCGHLDMAIFLKRAFSLMEP